jgi:hypothetical protein
VQRCRSGARRWGVAAAGLRRGDSNAPHLGRSPRPNDVDDSVFVASDSSYTDHAPSAVVPGPRASATHASGHDRDASISSGSQRTAARSASEASVSHLERGLLPALRSGRGPDIPPQQSGGGGGFLPQPPLELSELAPWRPQVAERAADGAAASTAEIASAEHEMPPTGLASASGSPFIASNSLLRLMAGGSSGHRGAAFRSTGQAAHEPGGPDVARDLDESNAREGEAGHGPSPLPGSSLEGQAQLLARGDGRLREELSSLMTLLQSLDARITSQLSR